MSSNWATNCARIAASSALVHSVPFGTEIAAGAAVCAARFAARFAGFAAEFGADLAGVVGVFFGLVAVTGFPPPPFGADLAGDLAVVRAVAVPARARVAATFAADDFVAFTADFPAADLAVVFFVAADFVAATLFGVLLFGVLLFGVLFFEVAFFGAVFFGTTLAAVFFAVAAFAAVFFVTVFFAAVFFATAVFAVVFAAVFFTAALSAVRFRAVGVVVAAARPDADAALRVRTWPFVAAVLAAPARVRVAARAGPAAVVVVFSPPSPRARPPWPSLSPGSCARRSTKPRGAHYMGTMPVVSSRRAALRIRRSHAAVTEIGAPVTRAVRTAAGWPAR